MLWELSAKKHSALVPVLVSVPIVDWCSLMRVLARLERREASTTQGLLRNVATRCCCVLLAQNGLKGHCSTS